MTGLSTWEAYLQMHAPRLKNASPHVSQSPSQAAIDSDMMQA